MAVVKGDYGKVHSLTGTAAEVCQALNDQGVPSHKVVEIFWDATAGKVVAVYYT